MIITKHSKWDPYFREVCIAVSSKSPCLSRKIGAILVRDNSIVSTGYNGPPRGIPHCGPDRSLKDLHMSTLIHEHTSSIMSPGMIANTMSNCPRKILGYESGTHMELCHAQHAEENAISNAARNGVSTIGCTLYMNCITPCKNCYGTLINAGITEIVINEVTHYDKYTQFLIKNSELTIRPFKI
jgi:dCMP deaminase